MAIRIKKIVVNGRSLNVTYQKNENTTAGDISDDITVKCGALVHDDFFTALNILKIHFAALCDLRESPPLEGLKIVGFEEYCTLANLDSIYLTALFIADGKSEGIEIGGGKSHGGRVINMTSPKISLDSAYIYLDNLYEAIESIKFETLEYLFNGKYAIKQLALDFEEDLADAEANENDNTSESLTPTAEEPPKRRGRKPKTVMTIQQTNIAS